LWGAIVLSLHNLSSFYRNGQGVGVGHNQWVLKQLL
jgi:hypothetical protein